MNNGAVDTMIQDCNDELDKIGHLVIGLGTSPVVNYLIKYAVIRACGTIEQSYKTIIADYYEAFSPQLVGFISKHVRESSTNPSYQNIKKQLYDFDSAKADSYKTNVSALANNARVIQSLESLRTLRNDVAHGSNITISITNVGQYFTDSVILIKELDAIVV